MFYPSGSELYVGHLDPEVSEDMFFAFFSPFGKIQYLKIMRHLLTHASRGFGFITFRSRAEAMRAQRAMNGAKILNQNIKVYLKETYDNLDPQANIVLLNIPGQLTEAQLAKLAEPFGPVFSVKVSRGETAEGGQGPKAFVQFESLEAAQKAIAALNGSELSGQIIAAEPVMRKNKVILKAAFSEDVVQKVNELLGAWGAVQLELMETSLDKTQCILSARFEAELPARAFLQDFSSDKSKCGISRPADCRRLRAVQHKVLAEEF